MILGGTLATVSQQELVDAGGNRAAGNPAGADGVPLCPRRAGGRAHRPQPPAPPHDCRCCPHRHDPEPAGARPAGRPHLHCPGQQPGHAGKAGAGPGSRQAPAGGPASSAAASTAAPAPSPAPKRCGNCAPPESPVRCLLATYQLAKEGLDIPRADRLFLVQPVRDATAIQQAVGRIMRPAPGKTDAPGLRLCGHPGTHLQKPIFGTQKPSTAN